MRKKTMREIEKSVQARARDVAARRIAQAKHIASVYADANMKMMFPGEEVD